MKKPFIAALSLTAAVGLGVLLIRPTSQRAQNTYYRRWGLSIQSGCQQVFHEESDHFWGDGYRYSVLTFTGTPPPFGAAEREGMERIYGLDQEAAVNALMENAAAVLKAPEEYLPPKEGYHYLLMTSEEGSLAALYHQGMVFIAEELN